MAIICNCVNPDPAGCPACQEAEALTRIRADVDDTLALFEQLRAWKTDIAAMRRDGAHVAAAIARDEMLCRIETWLDPAGAAWTKTVQDEQGRAARASSLERTIIDGVPSPF